MLSPMPAVVGVPGGVEVLVILLVLFLLFGVPLAVALVVGYKYVAGRTTGDRVDELEREVAELRDRLDAEEDDL